MGDSRSSENGHTSTSRSSSHRGAWSGGSILFWSVAGGAGVVSVASIAFRMASMRATRPAFLSFLPASLGCFAISCGCSALDASRGSIDGAAQIHGATAGAAIGLLTALRPSKQRVVGVAYPLAGLFVGAVTGLAIYNARHAVSCHIDDIQGEIHDAAVAAASRGQPPPPLPGPLDIVSGRWGQALATLGVPRREQPRTWEWPEWAPVRRVSDAEVKERLEAATGRPLNPSASPSEQSQKR